MGSAAAPVGSLARAAPCAAAYRPRNPRATSLYQLLDIYFESLKRQWEERFERRYAKVVIMRSLGAEPGSWAVRSTFNISPRERADDGLHERDRSYPIGMPS